ncbi:hypothetical protein T8S45_04130 [Blastomonas marina]|uniref:hypothetical protein n=1 Tax=Blastomonas marina TaxID=1867408 RepID=UPI002AC98387|nr:hypothetical protein [Blastomonas marina]WPZ04737.1 hypothetical protein T8S45_04130 [Blastomonas marina]
MVSVLNALSMGVSPFNDIKSTVETAWVVAFFAVPFVSFFAIFLALPIALIMRDKGYNSLLQFAVVGVVFGGFCGLLTPLDYPSPVWGFVSGLFPGFVAAITWWLFVERQSAKAHSND